MDKREFTNILFKQGKKKGLTDMEVFIQENSSMEIKVFQGEIDKYSIANVEGVSLRGVYNGKMGYSYAEKIDDTSIEMLIDKVIENAQIIDSDDEEEIQSPSKEYKNVNNYNDELDKIPIDEKIEFVKNLEDEALKLDNKVKSVDYCVYGEEKGHNLLINTKGMDLEEINNSAYSYVSVVVEDNGDVKSADSYVVSNKMDKFDYKKLANDAVKEGLSLLGAKSIKSGEYEVIFRNDAFANILEAFVPIFSAENVQKGLSLLKGKVNKKIGSSMVTIIEDPFMEDSIASRSFDGEGIATKYKNIVDKGILSTYLHNSKTAKKDGIESTGNASKPSYKSSISIAPTNMYLNKGDKSFEDMINSMNEGILIINVQGLHAGLNPISGDFSLSAYGYEIRNGKIYRPVNQITIASNFYDVLMNITEVGNDLKFVLPSGLGYIGSPSVRVKSISISGE